MRHVGAVEVADLAAVAALGGLLGLDIKRGGDLLERQQGLATAGAGGAGGQQQGGLQTVKVGAGDPQQCQSSGNVLGTVLSCLRAPDGLLPARVGGEQSASLLGVDRVQQDGAGRQRRA